LGVVQRQVEVPKIFPKLPMILAQLTLEQFLLLGYPREFQLLAETEISVLVGDIHSKMKIKILLEIELDFRNSKTHLHSSRNNVSNVSTIFLL
jgi:hypothetical protein